MAMIIRILIVLNNKGKHIIIYRPKERFIKHSYFYNSQVIVECRGLHQKDNFIDLLTNENQPSCF